MVINIESVRARQLIRRVRAVTAAAGGELLIHGLLIPYDLPSGDGRTITRDAVTWDLGGENSPPIPLLWAREGSGHEGATVGRVVEAWADDTGVNVTAVLDAASTDLLAREQVGRVAELVEARAAGWSAGLDDVTADETAEGGMRVTGARLRHVAIVDTPAFPGAFPQIGPAPVNAKALSGLTFPAAHFERWSSKDPVAFRVEADGRVWGHGAGVSAGRWPGRARFYQPDPDPEMKNFHTGTVLLDDGRHIRVGSLRGGGPHAPTSVDLAGNRAHHDVSTTVWARARAWDDEQGRLCFTGSVVPGLPAQFLGQVAGLGLSAELWPVRGLSRPSLVCAVSVPDPAWPV